MMAYVPSALRGDLGGKQDEEVEAEDVPAIDAQPVHIKAFLLGDDRTEQSGGWSSIFQRRESLGYLPPRHSTTRPGGRPRRLLGL